MSPPLPDSALPRLNLVVGGHVDHGKSTIVGRLLADTNSLPDGKLEQVRSRCLQTGKPFEYAFLLDALHDEQAQGITIDSARVFFRTASRYCIIIDAPGHVEFLRNLVTGAARAEAALLVIDAAEGIQDNSRRHGYMMSFLGIKQLVVVVNKMDLVGYDQGVFDRIREDYTAFLANIDATPMGFIPVSGREGECITKRSDLMPWYNGPTVLETLDRFKPAAHAKEMNFRMSVQDVYKFATHGDERRIVAGHVDSGTISVGDDLVFYPSGKRATLKSFEAFNRATPTLADAGESTGFTLVEQVYVTRGDLAVRADEPPPSVSTRFRASVFWLGQAPLTMHREYLFRIGAARATARIEAIHRVLDASSLDVDENRQEIHRHEVAEITIQTSRAIACDIADDATTTGRFVLVEDFEIRGGGIVRESLADTMDDVRQGVLLRNFKWEPSLVLPERRAERYRQRPTLVMVTGDASDKRKRLAKDVEARLFEMGNVVYYLGIGSVLYGVDADLERGDAERGEHIRRLAEVAHLLVDAGMILIVTAAELTEDELALVAAALEPDRLITVWVGAPTMDRRPDLHVPEASAEAVDAVKDLLQQRGVIFRP